MCNMSCDSRCRLTYTPPLIYAPPLTHAPPLTYAPPLLRHTLLPGHQQQPAALGQQQRPQEAQPSTFEPHGGGPGQHPQRAVPEGSDAVARGAAVLHGAPGQLHALRPAVPGPGPLPARPQHALGLLRARQERTDRHLAAR